LPIATFFGLINGSPVIAALTLPSDWLLLGWSRGDWRGQELRLRAEEGERQRLQLRKLLGELPG